jgi:hypothetical protein
MVCVNVSNENLPDPQAAKSSMGISHGVDFDSERTGLAQIAMPENWRSLKRGSRLHLGIPTGQEMQNKIRAELVGDIK